MSSVQPSLELLAPAGSLPAFETAVKHGADAIYIGAPALNARALARNFTLAEIAAMIDYGYGAGVKVYLAMNSLMKEDDIPAVIRQLSVLEQLGPDALIIQDIGLFYLIRRFFPRLPVHASTLMTVHNSLGVRQCAEMGFKRVVLAREMTIDEIRKAHAASPVELEVFVQGALCYSYSGLCLFSSYLGGKSGLRGRCVQPCRRRYTWAGKGKGLKSGYFFSMHDLAALSLLPEIAGAGVVSVKIEGRMRSANYVGSVVKAYRLAIDAGKDLAGVLPEAESLLAAAMGRRTTTAYFTHAQPKDAFSPAHSGNIGIFLGKIRHCKQQQAGLVLRHSVSRGERLRIHHEKSGERKSFTLQDIRTKDGSILATASADDDVVLTIAGSAMRTGDSLYKVDVGNAGCKRSQINSNSFKKLVAGLNADHHWEKVLARFQPRVAGAKRKNQRHRSGKTVAKNRVPAIWLKTDNLRLLTQPLPLKPERYLVVLDQETMRQYSRMSRKLHRLNSFIIWCLPPVIFEEDISFYQQAIKRLQRDGFRGWQLGHLSQFQFFNDLSGTGRGRRTGKERGDRGQGLKVGVDYTVNVLNSAALTQLAAAGLDHIQLSIENDQDNIQAINQARKGWRVGMTVYGRPPLFTARPAPEYFRFNQQCVSPRGERFELVKAQGLSLLLDEQPFSLLPHLQDPALAALDFVVVDVTNIRLDRKKLNLLFKQIQAPARGRGRRLSRFNYAGNLL